MRFGVLALLLVPCCTDTAATDVELLGEDPDALGGEPAPFAPFVAGKPVSQFVAESATTRQLSIASPDGRFAAGARVLPYRSFVQAGVPMWLVVDVESLQTGVLAKAWLDSSSVEAESTGSRRAAIDARTRSVGKALSSVTPSALEGHTRVALTVDMCQSLKPWDRSLFEWAVAEGARTGTPFELNVAMTGVWAAKHGEEFAQMQAWERSAKLRITWMNHSYRHPLHCTGGSCAFLTWPSEDVNAAAMNEEVDLLGRGEVPSVFFRFPGLVHNAKTLEQISKLGLYTVDGNAWLAKGQGIQDGAVILVHGNGNEPAGIRKFFAAVNGSWAKPLTEGRLRFVSMRDL